MARVANVDITPKTARRSQNQPLIDVEQIDEDLATGAGKEKGKPIITNRRITIYYKDGTKRSSPKKSPETPTRKSTRNLSRKPATEVGKDKTRKRSAKTSARKTVSEGSLDQFNEQYDETVRVFCLRPISELSEAADVLLCKDQDRSRICTTVAQFCPRGTRSATFLIDTSHLTDIRELNADIYGAWGGSSGHKGFFRKSDDGDKLVKVQPHQMHDFVVHRLKSLHRDTANRFIKLVYRCTDIQAQQPVPFALICYHWHCEPFQFTPTKAVEQRPKTSRVQEEESTAPEDPEILNQLDQQLPEGVVVFSTKAIHTMVELVMATQFTASISPDRVCSVRPQLCPDGVRSCTFVVDLSNVAHPRDLTCDRYGKWGSSSGQRDYFSVDLEDKTVQKVDPDIEAWDVMVNKLKYLHPDTDKQFCRTIYWQSDKHGRNQFGVICYEWKCEPFRFTPSAHGNSRTKRHSYMRTAPSVLESVRKAVTQYRPEDALEVLTNRTAPDVPRDIRQIRNMALRTPGAQTRKKCRNGERQPRRNDPPSKTIPPKEWKELLLKSAEISQSGQITDFPGQDEDDLYLVAINRQAFTVRRTHHADYECNCQQFTFYKFVCAHTHATAALDHVTNDFMQVLREKFRNDQPQTSTRRMKLLEASERLSGSPVKKRPKVQYPPSPAVSVSGLQIPSREEKKAILTKKPPTFTQPFHNDEPFWIVFIEDYVDDSERRECEHCQVGFPHISSSMAPEDVAIAHEERVMDPKTGRYGAETATKYIHARYACIVPRYPYFHCNLLQIDEATGHKIDASHKRHFEEQFGIDLHS